MVAAFQSDGSSRRSGRGCRDRSRLVGAAGRQAIGIRSGDPDDELARLLWASPRFLELVNGPALAKPIVGPLCRVLVLRLSVHAQMRERASVDERNFLLRLRGPLGQQALRNLLIWQNHVLPSYFQRDDGRQVDVALVLNEGAQSEAGLLDLFSVVLMLDRVRSFAVFPDQETAIAANSILLSERELAHWRTVRETDDLGNMPRTLIRQVERQGTRGGIKLLTHGRKYANDLLKLTLPGRYVLAVALPERKDGDVEPDELEFWLGLMDTLRSRHPQAAFVMLNCLPPSHWREWPAHIRFARRHRLSLQDTICLAQIADGYLQHCGLIWSRCPFRGPSRDLCSARKRRPAGRGGAPLIAKGCRIMAGSRDRVAIEAAFGQFAAAFPQL